MVSGQGKPHLLTVPGAGLEPARSFDLGGLSALRLPFRHPGFLQRPTLRGRADLRGQFSRNHSGRGFLTVRPRDVQLCKELQTDFVAFGADKSIGVEDPFDDISLDGVGASSPNPNCDRGPTFPGPPDRPIDIASARRTSKRRNGKPKAPSDSTNLAGDVGKAKK